MAVPEAVRPLLDGLVSLSRERFPKRLTSVYCLGSLAQGGWSPRLSDVDAGVVLRDPLEEADSPALVGICGEVAERYPRFGPRLSLFWATEAILRGQATGGRLGPLEAVDFAQNGDLHWGKDVRDIIRPISRDELVAALAADLAARWNGKLKPFHAREILAAGSPGGPGEVDELDERTLVQVALYPARFLLAADTGRLGGIAAAVQHYERPPGRPGVAAVRLAAAVRERDEEATAAERRKLAEAFSPMYAAFFLEIGKQHGLEIPRH